MLFSSFLRENFELDFFVIQNEVPIKTEKTFLYDYWNIFFQLYSLKIIGKFKSIANKKDFEIIDTISINSLIKIHLNNFYQLKNRKQSKDIKATLNSLFLSLQNNFKNFICCFQNRKNGLDNTLINLMGMINNSLNDCLFKNQPQNNQIINPNQDIFPKTLKNKDFNKNIEKLNNINFGNLSFFQILNNNIVSTKKIKSDSNHKKNMIKSSYSTSRNDIFKIGKTIFHINNDLNSNAKKEIYKTKEIIATKKDINSNSKIIFKAKICPSVNDKKDYSENKKNYQLKTPIPKSPTHIFTIKKHNQILLPKRKRLLKNKKFVFIQVENDFENNTNNISKEEENNKTDLDVLNYENEMLKKNPKSRRSKYRGVSKNGNNWQVLIMVKKKKKYLGSFSNEEEAAKVYDKFALQSHGIKAKTNYDYTKEELEKIMNESKKENEFK